MLYILDKNEQVRTILSNSNPNALGYYEDEHLEQLEGLLTYDFSIPANHDSASEIEVEGYVIVRDLDKKLMLFMIKRIEEIKENGVAYKRIYAESSAISDIRGEIVRPATLTAVSIKTAATHVLSGTGWELGVVELQELKDFDFSDYPTALGALNQIRDAYGAELAYRVEFDGIEVRHKYVDIVQKRGKDTGKRFEYKKDLVGVKREQDSSELVTALVAIGKSNEDGSRITFTDYEGSYGLFKPKGQDFVGDPDALQRYGKKGKHIFGRFEDSTAETWNILLKRATEELLKRNKPRLTYEVAVILLESLTGLSHEAVRIGDTVRIIDLTFVPALVLEARVIEILRSYTDPTKDSVVLGEFAPLFVDNNAEIAALKAKVNAKEGLWSAPSETIYKSTSEPADTDKKIDMLWLDLSEEPNLLKRWTGTAWVNASKTDLSQMNGQVSKVQVANNAIGSEQIETGAVGTEQIADKAVTSDTIADAAVIGGKLAPEAVTAVALAKEAVTAEKIAPVSIQAIHIEDAAIEMAKIKDGAITAIKLKDKAITPIKIADNAIQTTHIDAGAITEAKMKWNSHILF